MRFFGLALRPASSYHHPLALAVALVGTVTWGPALAAPAKAAASGTVTETLEVLGRQLDNREAAVGKMDVSLLEAPYSVSVVDSSLLQLRGSENINEALRYVSGVTPESRGGVVTRYDQFTVRGFDTYRNYWDGMQLMYNGWYLAPQIDSALIERVEILKGPASVLYGNAAPGGLVNLVSKVPERESSHSLGVRTGNQDLREISLDFTAAIGDSPFSYRVIGLWRERDGQALTTTEERRFIAPSLTWDLSDKTRLTVRALYQEEPEGGAYGAVPVLGSLKNNPLGDLDPDFYDGDENFEMFDRTQTSVGYSLAHQFNDTWTFTQNARWMDNSVDYQSVYSRGLAPDNRTLGRASIYSYEELTAVTLDNQLAGHFRSGPLSHTLLVGVDYQTMQSDLATAYGLAPSLDIFRSDNRLWSTAQYLAMTGPATLRDIEETQLGYYLQNQIKWNDWVLLLGGRYDEYQKETDTGGSQSDIDQDNFSARAGLLYQFESGFSPYVSYSESFEGQAGSNFAGQAFDPTTAEQLEAGIKYESRDKQTFATLSWFDITKQNMLTTDPQNPTFSVQNGEVEARGVELEMGTVIAERLSLSATYTDMEMENTRGDNKGKSPTQVADRSATLWAMYHFSESLSGIKTGVGVRHVGETWADPDNLDKVPSYTLVDLAFNWALGQTLPALQGTELNVSVTNLTDKRHVSGCSSQNWCWFGAERTIEAGVRYSW